MKNIKDKIERVEKETKRIEAIDQLITYCEKEHLKPVATFTNGGAVANITVATIDRNIMVKMLTEQRLAIELAIDADIQFLAAVELLSQGVTADEN